MSDEHHHEHSHEHEGPRGFDFFTNFKTYDAPFWKKVQLAFSNNLIKMRTHSNCCGNHGQPGC